MESYSAKKAKKARKALEADYPLEWEEQALEEVIQVFHSTWRKNRKAS